MEKDISCGPSARHHLEAIGKYVEAGFDHIILIQIGPNQDCFFKLIEHELAPALRERKPAADQVLTITSMRLGPSVFANDRASASSKPAAVSTRSAATPKPL